MQNGKEDEAYKARLEIAKQAFNSCCMISSGGSWYTPREFLDSDIKVEFMKVGMNTYTKNITMHHVNRAIGRKMEDLQKAQKDFDAFMVKILGAFELNPIESKRKKT